VSFLSRLTQSLLSGKKLRSKPPDRSSSLNFIIDDDFDLDNRPHCPKCNAEDIATIIYGKPLLSRKILAGFESGRLISGGCLVRSTAPRWHCNQCGADFGQLD